MIRKGIIISLPFLLALMAWGYFYLPETSSAISSTPEYQIITDLAGKQVRVKKDIQKIVLLRSKDIYSLAVLLGNELPEKLVGWGPDLKTDDADAYAKFITRFPDLKKVPVTGSVYHNSLSVEQIIQLAPDLVIADKYLLEKGFRYMDKMAEAKLPVVCLNGSEDPFTGPTEGILFLGKLLKKEQKAQEIAKYAQRRIRQVVAKIDSLQPAPPSVYLEAGLGGPAKYGQTYGSSGLPKTFTSWGAVLHKLRVHNIAEEKASTMEPVNPEFVLKADPDVIVITGQNWNTSKDAMKLGYQITRDSAISLLSGFTSRPGWQNLAAVKSKRFHSIFHNSAAITCFAAIEALAKDCYPTLFDTLDPEDDLQEFYHRFMPVEYSGTWMISLP